MVLFLVTIILGISVIVGSYNINLFNHAGPPNKLQEDSWEIYLS